MNEIERLEEQARRVLADARAQVERDSDSGTALVPTSDRLPADSVKRSMQEVRSSAAHRRAEVEKVRNELRSAMQSQMDEMRRAMDVKMDEMQAVLGPLQEQVARMEEGIWTVNLFLGRDEEIVQLADGEPSPATVPLTIRQQVLYMDEETAALAESGGMDFSDLGLFDEWIVDAAHLEQVAPEQRCVVALKPRRTDVDYGMPPVVNDALNANNKRSYWLIRNGDRLYRMTTDLDVGDRLMPNRDEFTSLFRTTRFNFDTRQDEVIDLVPGSREWMKAEKAQGARQRHYMRVALVLQGLMERTTVFQPLPNGRAFSILHPEAYQAGLVRVVGDAELSLGTGRTPFYGWLAGLNAQLRPGMRIIGVFNTSEFRETNNLGERDYGHSRLWPRTASSPESLKVYRLEKRDSRHGRQGFTFAYARTDKQWLPTGRWGDPEYRAPRTKASCLVATTDRFILPFDLVTVAEMRAYLSARSDRHAYAAMMPLLHAAIAAKEAEALAERPFCHLLVGEIMKAHNVAVDDAEALVADLVEWWKLRNRWHRPLVTGQGDDKMDPATEAKAVRMIVADASRQRSAAGVDAQADSAAVARLLAHDPTVMFAGRTRESGYLAFAPMPMAFPPTAAAPNVWVREHRSGVTARSAIKSRDWLLPANRAARTRALHQTDVWAGWDLAAIAADHLTDPEITDLAEQAKRAYDRDARVPHSDDGADVIVAFGVTHDRRNRTFEVWGHPEIDTKQLVASTSFSMYPQVCQVRVRWERSKDGTAGLRLSNKLWVNTDHWSDPDHKYPWGPCGTVCHETPAPFGSTR